MEKIAVQIGTGFNSPFGQQGGLGLLVSVIVSNALVISGVILLFLMVFGGISVIIGAGSNDPQKVAQGKSALTSALLGFVIIFAAYWIIQLVEIVTGANILNISL